MQDALGLDSCISVTVKYERDIMQRTGVQFQVMS